jgi:hypothetical protein
LARRDELFLRERLSADKLLQLKLEQLLEVLVGLRPLEPATRTKNTSR